MKCITYAINPKSKVACCLALLAKLGTKFLSKKAPAEIEAPSNTNQCTIELGTKQIA